MNDYEYGISQVIIQIDDERSAHWPGVVSFSMENKSSHYKTPIYDGAAMGNIFFPAVYSGNLECYTYPPFLDEGDSFIGNLAYRTEVDGGYKLHFLYNCSIFFETHSGYETMVNVDPSTFKWGVLGMGGVLEDGRRFIQVSVDSRSADEEAMIVIQEILRGSDTSNPRVPGIEELEKILQMNATLIITDNGDGTYKAEGPDNVVYKTSDTEFEISWPSVVVFHGPEGKFQVSSL